MKIIVLGYMGSGKSTIGKLLALHLGLPFVDLDAYMESQEEMTVGAIFKEKGELYFRKKESEYLKNVLDENERLVLSTGGGTPCYGNNLDVMLETTPLTFYLKMSLSGLVTRLIPEKESRPMIRNIPDDEMGEFIGKHLFERSYFYMKAHHTIVVDNRTPEEIVSELLPLANLEKGM